MANPYIDTQLIECNRRQSTQQEQVDKLESNALYTNKVGDTILLKSGDTIQVQSAFINQKGCNIPTSLEFKGKYLTTVKLEKTTPTKLIYNVAVDRPGLESHSQYPENNDIVDINVFDNKATLEVNYYKTSNGEQYSFLPRQHFGQIDTNITNNDSNFVWGTWTINNFTTDDSNRSAVGNKSGICYYPRYLDNAGTRVTDLPAGLLTNWNDYHLVGDYQAGGDNANVYYLKAKNDNSKYTLFTRCYNWTDYSAIDGYEVDGKTANGETWYDYCIGRDLTSLPDKLRRYECPFGANMDPARCYYTRQVDHVEIGVNKGFNSAQSVAEQITEDLQKYIETETEGAFKPTGQYNQSVNSATTTSLLKPWHASNPTILNKTTYEYQRSTIGATPVETPNQDGLDLINSYKHILVKRPDLFELGRRCNNRYGQVPIYTGVSLTAENTDTAEPHVNFNFVKNNINFDTAPLQSIYKSNKTEPIVTSWLWEDQSLEALRDLFICQGQYPDLFKVENVAYDYIDRANQVFTVSDWNGGTPILRTNTINNSRFLHMTRINYSEDGINTAYLGNDDYVRQTYGGGNFDISHMTAPIFFKYDITNVNKYTDGNSIQDLCYGFATKTHLDGLDYITIHPEVLAGGNGISSTFFMVRQGKSPQPPARALIPGNIVGNSGGVGGNTLIGWDYHFNSFGNVVMMAQTGYLTQTPNCEWSIATGEQTTRYMSDTDTGTNLNKYYTRMYLGANNTACVYDTVSNKFGWEYMHIPENVGQLYNSGESQIADPTSTTQNRLPLIDDAKNQVYKINKRLNYWTFCPDMVPYKNAQDGEVGTGSSALGNGGLSFHSTGVSEISLFNVNLEPWTVFDAHMGVNLNFGKCCDKLNWDKSLLGIMGHTYEQFNPKEITKDNNGTQTRITFNNITDIFNPSTNSEVVSSDIIDYIITPFGATQFYPQPTTIYSIRDLVSGGPHSVPVGTFVNYYPAISQVTQSIILEAVNLPTTVLNPYLNIRSDIISDSKYFGGLNSGLNYPIVAVVNKINADKDFIQLDGSDIIFTVKKDMALSSITTVITDPDGSLALVDEGSSVIYKIQRQKNGLDLNILQQIMEGEIKKKK